MAGCEQWDKSLHCTITECCVMLAQHIGSAAGCMVTASVTDIKTEKHLCTSCTAVGDH